MNQKKSKRRCWRYLPDVLRGAGIGCAFIIPGFSGGSVAAILGIYERLVGAIADILHSFKKSLATLLPIGIGMVLGIISLLFPLKWALSAFPIPTVCLFLGLALGGVPSITDELRGGIKPSQIPAFFLPFILAAGLAFLPIGADVDLFALDFFGYLLLFLVGAIGASALVIPGISGSMLLLIFGYYNPIVRMLTDHLLCGKDVLKCLLVLGTVALGIAIGFFMISVIMKRLLRDYPRGTYTAILGFILGSIPSLFASVAKEANLTLATALPTPLYTIASIFLLLLGVSSSFALYFFAKKKRNCK